MTLNMGESDRNVGARMGFTEGARKPAFDICDLGQLSVGNGWIARPWRCWGCSCGSGAAMRPVRPSSRKGRAVRGGATSAAAAARREHDMSTAGQVRSRDTLEYYMK